VDDALVKLYQKEGKALPSHDPHGTDEDIRANLRPLKPNSWRLEGNVLIGDTDWGPLAQTIPTNYILTGTDDDGNPVFKKIA
jgi:hypothetical protein